MSLIQWSKPMTDSPWGYYASFCIGAEWVDGKEAIVVTTKGGMEHIDFLGMFMTCFTSNLEVDTFSKIYSIDYNQSPIYAPSLKSVVSPLIVLHFLGVVSRLKSLKRGYIHHSENLKKVKGRIRMMKNERLNIAAKRYDRIYCDHNEYCVDTPENRLLKKALIFSKLLMRLMGESHKSYDKIRHMLNKALSMFENVGDEVDIKKVSQIKANKLFKEYAEAVRLAKIVLRHFDYSISNVNNENGYVVPFTLDMSLLYEHYVYGLLYAAYGEKISYQFEGRTGFPDFLYIGESFKAILDAKYIPKFDKCLIDTYIIRQLSGYSRDIPILRHLGYEDIDETSEFPSVPCVIIYPKEGCGSGNVFLKSELSELCTTPEKNISRLYKICVPIPTRCSKS